MLAQYEINYESGSRVICEIGYGLLEMIFACRLPDEEFFGDLHGREQLLVLIEPCKTEGKDASLDCVEYRTTKTSFVTDIRNVKRLIGRVLTRGKWGIIDRTPGTAQTSFVEEEDED